MYFQTTAREARLGPRSLLSRKSTLSSKNPTRSASSRRRAIHWRKNIARQTLAEEYYSERTAMGAVHQQHIDQPPVTRYNNNNKVPTIHEIHCIWFCVGMVDCRSVSWNSACKETVAQCDMQSKIHYRYNDCSKLLPRCCLAGRPHTCRASKKFYQGIPGPLSFWDPRRNLYSFFV